MSNYAYALNRTMSHAHKLKQLLTQVQRQTRSRPFVHWSLEPIQQYKKYTLATNRIIFAAASSHDAWLIVSS